MYDILYPTVGKVSEKTLVGWYYDALANGECEEALSGDIDDICCALEDAGLVTFKLVKS